MKSSIFFFTFASAIGFIPLIIYLSHRFRILDRPNERKVHTASISRLGGIAIFLSITCGFLLCLKLKLLDLHDQVVLECMLGGLIAFLVGVVDDIKNVSYKIKLGCQFFLAFLVYFIGFKIDFIQIGFGSPLVLGHFSVPLTIFWVVMIMNAVNMIDGLDGLAGGISAIVFSAIAILGFFNGNPAIMLLSMIFAAACMGFLVFNFHPAKIFMGDSGSMMLGFFLAILTITSGQNQNTISIFTPFFFLAFPLIDLSISILRRMIYAKTTEKDISFFGLIRRTFDADGNHIHHRLLKLGFSQRKIAFIIYTFTAISCGLGLLSVYFAFGLIFFLFIFYVWFTVQSIRLLDYEEFVTGSTRNQKRDFEEKKKLSTAPSLIKKVL